MEGQSQYWTVLPCVSHGGVPPSWSSSGTKRGRFLDNLRPGDRERTGGGEDGETDGDKRQMGDSRAHDQNTTGANDALRVVTWTINKSSQQHETLLDPRDVARVFVALLQEAQNSAENKHELGSETGGNETDPKRPQLSGTRSTTESSRSGRLRAGRCRF